MSILASFPGEPSRGWINLIRMAFRMSYHQVGIRLGITTQNARHLEQKEQSGTIRLKPFREIAISLKKYFIYGLSTKKQPLSCKVQKKDLQ